MSIEKLRISKIIERMCFATNAKNTVKLSKLLGYKSTGTISGWKKTGVPDSAIAKVSEISSYRFEWIKSGEGDMRAPPDRGHSIIREEHERLITAYDASSPETQRIAMLILEESAKESGGNVEGGSD